MTQVLVGDYLAQLRQNLGRAASSRATMAAYTFHARVRHPVMKTFSATRADCTHDWYVVDAEGIPLGRLASAVAQLIRGKHKPTFTPHMDGGDFVIVLNAKKVKLTGSKAAQKTYFRYSGYMGHEQHVPIARELERHPERIIERAVFGMLPKNSLSRQKLRRKLKVYAGGEHPHEAQQPKTFAMKVAS